MRVKKVNIKNLFELYDHEINLNMENHITIIHGQNGVGKTIILEMIKSLFCLDYKIFYDIPFDEFSVSFDDGNTICLKKIVNKKSSSENNCFQHDTPKNEISLILSHSNNKNKNVIIKKRIDDRKDIFSLIRTVPGLIRIDDDKWIYDPENEIYSSDEIMWKFGLNFDEKNMKEWFINIKKSININFITTQRLFTFKRLKRDFEYSKGAPIENTVMDYSRELSDAIQKKLAEYASLSQSLDRTFPIRLAKTKDDVNINKLKEYLSSLEERRTNLIKTGLLDEEKEINFREFQELTEENAHVLSVYIEDVKKKLDVFNELRDKIYLFVNIINSRFANKSISINKNTGFIFTTSNNKKILPTNLSSGEQHELILYYELLFRIKHKSLILIDEPEISLHIGWQKDFLSDLQKVLELVDLDVLIATHSPDIIEDRWDLTVKLDTSFR
ncbi:MAG: AAA family ATPase [Methanosarcinaceae archaeon]|nr:AAA family ATPase [Methanosarcinaceae archaeon]